MTGDRNQAAPNSDSVLEGVLQLSRALLQAVNGSDLPGVMGVWSADGLLMPPHHPTVRGRMAITDYFEQLFRLGRFVFEFTASEVEVAGDLAIERVEYRASFFPTGGGDPSRDVGKGLHVFQRHPKGEWRLVMDIWNSDYPLAASSRPNGA